MISLKNSTLMLCLMSLILILDVSSSSKNNPAGQENYKIIRNESNRIGEKNKNIKISLVENFSIGKNPGDTLIFGNLTHIVIDKKGHIYVLDKENLKIYKFNKKGTFLKSFGNNGDGPGEFLYPNDMGITPSNILVIVDRQRSRVIKYSTDGEFLAEFDPGRRKLNNLLCNSTNKIILVGPLNDKIFHVFDLDGNFIKSIGEPIEYYPENSKYLNKIEKSYHLNFRTPKILRIDKNDYIIHNYTFSNRMRIIDKFFKILMIIEREDPEFTPPIDTGRGLMLTAEASSILRMNDDKIIQFMFYSKKFENPHDDYIKMEIYSKDGSYLGCLPLNFNGYGVAVDENDNLLFVVNEEKSYITSYKLQIDF